MAFHYSSDPVRDAERYAADQDAQMERLPVCACCGYPIQSEYLYRIEEQSICAACLEDNYRKRTEDFMS